jgi:hypothetical protein
MAYTFDDSNSIPKGMTSLTISTDTYIAEDFNLDEPTNITDIQDQDGNTIGGFGSSGTITGTATVQVPASEGTVVVRGVEFTHDSVSYIVTSVGKSKRIGEVNKYSLAFRKKYN